MIDTSKHITRQLQHPRHNGRASPSWSVNTHSSCSETKAKVAFGSLPLSQLSHKNQPMKRNMNHRPARHSFDGRDSKRLHSMERPFLGCIPRQNQNSEHWNSFHKRFQSKATVSDGNRRRGRHSDGFLGKVATRMIAGCIRPRNAQDHYESQEDRDWRDGDLVQLCDHPRTERYRLRRVKSDDFTLLVQLTG